MVFVRIKDKKEKGVSKIKIFINIYLREYEKTKFNNENDKVLLIKPFSVKIFKEVELMEIWLFILDIKLAKQIFWWNKSSPILQINEEIFDIISKKNEIIKNEEFIQIPYKIIFIKKLDGLSTFSYVKWANKNLIL